MEELNDKFKSLFTVEDTITPTHKRWDGEEEDLNRIETVRKDICWLLKKFDTYKAQGSDEVSQYVRKECPVIVDRSLEIWLNIHWKRVECQDSGK